MDDIQRDFLVSIAAFVAIFGIIYVFLVTRHRERILMIERGLDVNSDLTQAKNMAGATTLKVGVFLIGIALGVLVGNVLTINSLLNEEVAYFSMTLLFGGGSLIVFYLTQKKSK